MFDGLNCYELPTLQKIGPNSDDRVDVESQYTILLEP